jgi:hypothetical protein
MDHDRLAAFGGDFQLLFENRSLDLARRKIVVVIEADFADGEDSWMRGQGAQFGEGPGGGLGGVVRMDSDGGVDECVAIGQAHGGFEIGGAIARADGHHGFDTRGQRALDYLVPVFVELWVIQVAMRIN